MPSQSAGCGSTPSSPTTKPCPTSRNSRTSREHGRASRIVEARRRRRRRAARPGAPGRGLPLGGAGRTATWRPADGDDRGGQGRAEPGAGDAGCRRARPSSRRCCASPARCTWSAATSSSRPSWTPARSPGGCARRSPTSSATARRCRSSRAAGCARAAATSSGSPRTARGWPARPAWSTCAGRPVKGLPHHVVAGGIADAEAAWRGAFLAHGSLTEPGRACSLEITCPSAEAALALVGVGRRLGVSAKAREVRGGDRVVVRDGDAIGALLTRIGAHESVLAWEERRMRREVRATANRLANFDDANLRRSARAAVAAGARVERALEILADDAPEHLLQAGRLRLEHKQASLEELGALSDPVMTKDAVAGRIRRLLAMADKRAAGARHPGHRVGGHPGDARALTFVGVGDRAVISGPPAGIGCQVGGPPAARRRQVVDHRRGASAVTVRVGINGFGRIGRNFFRAAHRLRRRHRGRRRQRPRRQRDAGAPAEVRLASWAASRARSTATDDEISVDGKAIKALPSATRPSCLGRLGADVVIESTGLFTEAANARMHVDAGAKKVIISAPAKNEDVTIVHGRQRRRLRPGQAQRHLQRLLHHQLPGPAGQGAQRRVRHRARPDDHHPRLHAGPEPAGRPAQGPAPGPRRRAEHRPDLAPAPPRRSAWCCPS